METITWVLITLVVVIVCLYDYWKKSYFKRRGIPSDPVWPFLGHFHLFVTKGFFQAILDSYRTHGKIFGMFAGTSPIVIISDPDMLKEILIRNFSHFYNRQHTPFDDYPLNKGLLRLTGARWKKVRNTITPAFSAAKMKPIAAHLNDCCDILVKNLQVAIATNPDVEVKGVYGNLTMDSIAKAGFGLQVDSQEDPSSPFLKNAKEILNMKFYNPFVLIAFFLPQVAPLFNYFKIGITSTKAKNFFMDVTHHAMQMRQGEEGSKRVDLLQLMVDAQSSSNDTGTEADIPEIAGGEDKSHPQSKADLTDDEIMAQSLLFFLAGFETTNTALCLVSYNLAVHPDLQEKLFQEVQEVAPDRDSVTYDTVNKMEYLDKFVSECLRLYPSGAGGDRVCQEDITIGDFHFEKGMVLMYNIIALHYNPDLWEDPEKFDPERFTKEAKEKRHPFAYLPFGTGPRNCIGMRFALLTLKLSVVRMVQSFKFEPCEETPIPLKFGTTSIIPDNRLKLRILARK